MITFQLFKNGLYLTQADIANPAQARIGFLFQDASRTDPTFTFSSSEWTSPQNQGYFAFFAPAARSDWDTFAGQLRTGFQSQGAQLGWFSDSGQGANLVSGIQVSGQGTSSPTIQGSPALIFGNITLFVVVPFGSTVPISFDDPSNSFLIANPGAGTQNAVVQLTVQQMSGSLATFYSNSANLTLPLIGTGAGTTLAAFQISAANPSIVGLEAFETGLMYFAPPVQGQLTALGYPVFRGPGGSGAPLNLSGSFDVLAPTDPTRTFLQFIDPALGSFFAAPTGQVFGLQTVNDTPANASRLVLANRPVNATSDTGRYYLTPAGKFNLTSDTASTARVASSQAAGGTSLLAGIAGTEFFNVAVGAAPDALVFTPAQPAFKQSGGTQAAPTYLDSVKGNVTTSWAQLVTTTGSYVTQPEQSPLYQQNGQSPAAVNGAANGSSLTVYLLNFNALTTWPAPVAMRAAAGPLTSPMVPMAPYAGISSTADSATFVDMEVTALGPARRTAFLPVHSAHHAAPRALADPATLTWSMMPQGLLAGLDSSNSWTSTQFATSPSGILQFANMGSAIRASLLQNQIFVVATTTKGLFDFKGTDQQIEIAGWPFNLSPEGQASDATPPVPPILILKFYQNKSISDLVDDISLWSQPSIFNTTFSADSARTYLQGVINDAAAQVQKDGQNSLYYNFYQAVTDPAFSGVLAVNCNMELNSLPSAIRAVMGGMTKDTPPVSNIDAFRVHHVGVQINDTDPGSSTPTLAQSSLFGLVDYEKPASKAPPPTSQLGGIGVSYNFEVEYLRALFTNSELRTFECQINLTINNIFSADVSLQDASPAGPNVVVITGSYQAHSTTGDDTSSGEGVYSFVAEGDFSFDFTSTTYLKNVTLTKLQFSFNQETPVSGQPDTTTISSSFAIWGSMVFQNLDVLDIFSFDKLVFENLGIDVVYQLTLTAGKPPSTTVPQLTFHPGDLRFDLGATTNRESSTSMLSLLPFKLTSFLYSETADKTLADLNYFSLNSIPNTGIALTDTFNYALIFDMDLGSAGALGKALCAFKFSFIVGWTGGDTTKLAFGVQTPEADGKLEISIEGVFSLVIELFVLKYSGSMLILVLHNAYMEILGKRLPPSGTIDFVLFVPTANASKLGWMVALNNESGGELAAPANALVPTAAPSSTPAANGDSGSVFNLLYLGLGQRVGPDPAKPPTDFASFLAFMTTDFFTSFEDGTYETYYHPDGGWIVCTHFKLLEIVEVGFVFYDYTPFYSLVLNVAKLFNFEITYTKISDTIGLFYANLTLPDNLRTFQVGAASLTLPAIGISVYTNGDFKVDVGFPDGDDWSRCFQVQAMAGPVPVTGAGGFYIAKLSSATSNVFQDTYPLIIAFGFAARLGVGKDFTSGPLKAGISVTFFGIIEGAGGYLATGSAGIFQKPDALMLQGQFGIIGQIYGSVDFGIIKASVNVTLQASIGIVLHMEVGYPGNILLYIQASVSVSASISIDLGFFSITISFSFSMSVQFQWELAGGSSSSRMQLAFAARAIGTAAPVTVPLCPGMNPALPLWFLPEMTAVFPNSTATGTPWFACSLGIAYNASPTGQPPYSQFQPFETLAAMLVTWALTNTQTVTGCSSAVTQDELNQLDQNPDALVGWVTWGALLSELELFQAAIAVPTKATAPAQATVFPMLPFLQLQTTGRLDGGTAADYNYVFGSKNAVSDAYLAEVDSYFNQMFVNQSASGPSSSLPAGTTTPLIQEVFTDYFTGLIRGAVHQLLERMQNNGITSSPLDQLIQQSVGAGQFVTLAGQMSSTFRGGARLPNTPGLTLPYGTPQATNPLYALLWQQFPAGQVPASPGYYTVALTNSDSTQKWVTSTVSWQLTTAFLTPWQNLTAAAVTPITTPTAMPLTNTGPQSFSFQNAIAWTQPQQQTPVSLRPFPANLARLQSSLNTVIDVLVESRPAGGAFLPNLKGTPLPPSGFAWATTIPLVVKQIPAGNSGAFLPDVFALAGASQAAQVMLEQILQHAASQIASVQILYQTAAGAAGLNSATINTADVFVLRTNTTTVAAPPSGGGLQVMAFTATAQTPVGANIGDAPDFLQIVQQAVVTNAPGYYLRYIDASGNSLPAALFAGQPAAITILIEFKLDGSGNTPASPALVEPWYNAIVLNSVTSGLLYYAETTAPALAIQYPAVAAGAAGMLTTRTLSAEPLKLPSHVAAEHKLAARHSWSRQDLVDALVASGVKDEATLRARVAAAGGTSAQLSALYSLVGFQVPASTGFIASNLSAAVQPSQVNGVYNYQAFVPLYSLATANQGVNPPNRYASIGDAWSASLFLNDPFGNQLPSTQSYPSTNLYFDPITPLDQWLGVVPTYDFLSGKTAQPNNLTVYLSPSSTAFINLTSDPSTALTQLQAALTLYQTVQNQLLGEGVSLYVESSLSLQSGGVLMNQVLLSTDQTTSVQTMVAGIISWLNAAIASPTKLPPFTVAPVPLTVILPASAALPPLFEISVLFGIQRLASLIDPSLKNQFDVIIFPSAQNVATTIASTVGKSLDQGASSVSIVAFAANFVVAFPSFTLSVTVDGSQSSSSQQAALRRKRALSSVDRTTTHLKRLGLAGDGSSGSSAAGPQSLWAVQTSLLGISIGASGQVFYASPKPLDNSLNSGTVPMPTIPSGITPQLPKEQLFTDVDLDQFGGVFFTAVDNFLAPASAAYAFEVANAAYTTVAQGRESIANKYSAFEIDWLFPAQSPFTGTGPQLTAARDSFDQQMRSALASAYAIDTIVQFPVTWASTPPPSVLDEVALYGKVQPASGPPPSGVTLSAAQVAVNASGTSLLTFLFGTSDVQDTAEVSIDLVYNVTHIEYFLYPASQTPPDQARPSMWLQLVNPYPQGVPHIGLAGPTTIPIVFRQYPTPPTLISQSAVGANSSQLGSLADAASWIYSFEYQVQLTGHDQLGASITYNTDLSVSGAQGRREQLAAGPTVYTLFEALARFNAAYPILLPVLVNPANTNWAAAAGAFASLVTDVVQNKDWNPPLTAALGARLVNITDNYIITDAAQAGSRLATLAWDPKQGESSFAGATLSIAAIGPDYKPYPGQTQGTGTNSVNVTYTPVPPLVNDWVIQLVAVNGLNVLSAENALAGVQVERNVITIGTSQARAEFVYMTPLVRPSQPATPFVDNDVPINVATLPNQGQGAQCPTSPSSLCQRIYTMFYDLIGNPSQVSRLQAARLGAGLDETASRRVKMSCGFKYPVASAAGGTFGVTSISPVFPVVLARSFEIDGADASLIGQLAVMLSGHISNWASSNGIVFGSAAFPGGGQLIFDITLYAQLSGVNTPVLRLSNLQLNLTDVDPS